MHVVQDNVHYKRIHARLDKINEVEDSKKWQSNKKFHFRL